jgi:hypothetical protein
MTTETGEDLITQAEAARLRGVTRSAIAYLITQGRLRTYERFGVTFVSRREVENYEPLKPGPRPKAKTNDAPASKKKGSLPATPKFGSIELQTRTTRKLDAGVKRSADKEMGGRKKGGRK